MYYSNKNELPILHLYNNLILYVYRIFAKIKTNEELTKSIYNELSYCHNQLFLAKTFKDKKMKYKYLLLATASVDYLTATMRIVKKLKLITPKNYTVWSYKIAGIDKSLQKWMISCQKP
ncbi:MAG: hypothetical protein PHX04_02365 [Bacilli bacterium]|nr:hypothetical protein [Bacilli bacterium]